MQALLNSSQKYHDAMDNFKEYGVEVSDVKIVLPQMMKQKDKAVAGLTSGIEGLFKKNKVNSSFPAFVCMPSSLRYARHAMSHVCFLTVTLKCRPAFHAGLVCKSCHMQPYTAVRILATCNALPYVLT